jgi:hypothetical protein
MRTETSPGPTPEAPPLRTDLARAIPVAIRGGLLAALLAAAIGQTPPLAVNLTGGGLAIVTQLTLGWLYTVASNAVAVEVRGLGSGRVEIVAATIRLALLTCTAVLIWALVRAGSATARRVADRPVRRIVAGASVAVTYAIPIGLVSWVVRLRLGTGGGFLPDTVSFRAVVWEAFAVPFLLAAVSGAAGGLRASRAVPAGVRSVLAGGWRAFLAAIVLSLACLLLIAALRPSGPEGYVDQLRSLAPRTGALWLGHQGLLLPNQATLALVPAMGACDVVTLDGRSAPVLCVDRLPAGRDPSEWLVSAIDDTPGTPTRSAPVVVRILLLAPLAATAMGGWRAGAAAGSVWAGAARGLLAGVVFATLVGIAAWASTVTIESHPAGPASGGRAIEIGARPLEAAAYGLAWGAVVGAVSGAIVGLRARARAAEATPA